MELHTSETISDTSNINTNNELSLSFEVVNGGTETVYIEDKLLTNYEVAQARAESVLLEDGYINKRISINTYHIDNLHIGDIFQVDGLLYKTISINEKIQGAKVSMDIVGERAVSSEYTVLYSFVTLSGIQCSVSNRDGFMYGGTQNNGEIYRSIDGVIWTLVFRHTTFGSVFSITVHNGVLYAAIQEYALGIQLLRSVDGENWDIVKSISTSYLAFVYSDGANIYLIAPAKTGYTTEIYRSGIGLIFDKVADITSKVTSMTKHSDGKLYLGSYVYTTSLSQETYSSADGIVWSLKSSGIYEILSLVSLSGYLYGVNYDGMIFRSINGVSWERVLNNINHEMYTSLVFEGALYIPTWGGVLLYSENGITWTELYEVPNFTSWLWSIVAHRDTVFYFDGYSNCYSIKKG